MHKFEDNEIFRLNWCHTGVLLKRNAAPFSSNNYYIARSFVVDCVGIYNEISQKLYRKCIGNDKKIENFLDKFRQSLDESSPKQQVVPLLRGFNILGYDVYR